MTTAIHHGDPGSYKSFAVVQRVMVPSVLGTVQLDDAGEKISYARPIVTNIRGFNSHEDIEKALGKKVNPDSEIIYVDADKTKGFEIMGHFFHWAPKGALIVIDEAQRVYSKRRHRNLSCYDLPIDDLEAQGVTQSDAYPYWDGDYDRPTDVENAFDQHRHYNWDIYLCTPNINKLHPEIREVAEVAYRHKGRGHLLPWWKNKWREYAHDAELSGKSPSHYEGTPKTYKANKKYFACYKSTKTGKAKSTSEVRAIYSDPKLLSLLLFAFLFLGAGIYQAVSFAEDKTEALEAAASSLEDSAQADQENANVPDSSADPVIPDKGRIETAFDKLAFLNEYDPKADGSDLLSEYQSRGYSFRLSALLTVSLTGKQHYRISVLNGSTIVDRLTPDDLDYFGYKVKPVPNGLVLRKNDKRFLVRQWVIAAATRRDDEQPRGGFAKQLSDHTPMLHLAKSNN